jgi:hypothetical protein
MEDVTFHHHRYREQGFLPLEYLFAYDWTQKFMTILWAQITWNTKFHP